MNLALSLLALAALAHVFAWAPCKAAARNGGAVWPELVDEEGRR